MSTSIELKKYAKDLSQIVNIGFYKCREDYDKHFDEANTWLNDIICRDPKLTKKKKSCEISGYNKKLQGHHIAGKKHDDRTIKVYEQYHRIFGESQKMWGNGWEKGNQPERLRRAFFLMGLRDILRLKSKVTGISIYESIADNYTDEISILLKSDP